MSIKIREITNKLLDLPRPNRREVEKIIKEIYEQGKEDGVKAFKKK